MCFCRLVYRWFLLVYQITYAFGIVGYVILLLLFTGLGLVFPGGPDVVMEFGVILIFYGVYFGVMGRDCAELCVDYMAARMTVSSLELYSEMMTSCFSSGYIIVHGFGEVPSQGEAE